jgi:sterol desaturase/sphingolipid hydroxylase (fatty acid hydroxylase superfamily)
MPVNLTLMLDFASSNRYNVLFFQTHVFAILIGHLNYANLGWSYGRIEVRFEQSGYAHLAPRKVSIRRGRLGVNFGISLSVWDYLFGTSYLPHDGRDIEIGVKDSADFLSGFLKQIVWPFVK